MELRVLQKEIQEEEWLLKPPRKLQTLQGVAGAGSRRCCDGAAKSEAEASASTYIAVSLRAT